MRGFLLPATFSRKRIPRELSQLTLIPTTKAPVLTSIRKLSEETTADIVAEVKAEKAAKDAARK